MLSEAVYFTNIKCHIKRLKHFQLRTRGILVIIKCRSDNVSNFMTVPARSSNDNYVQSFTQSSEDLPFSQSVFALVSQLPMHYYLLLHS